MSLNTLCLCAAGQLLRSVHECDREGDSNLQGTATADESLVTKDHPLQQAVLSWADFCVLAAEFYCRSHPQSGKEEDGWSRWSYFVCVQEHTMFECEFSLSGPTTAQ